MAFESSFIDYCTINSVRSFSEYSFREIWHRFTLSQNIATNKSSIQILRTLVKQQVLKMHSYSNSFNEEFFLYALPNQDSLTAISGIKQNAYFVYQSALHFHQLLDYEPQTQYLNFEHSPNYNQLSKPILTQEAIDNAFSIAQRKSIVEYQFQN